MRILLIAMGSRGDVQPIIALAKGLQDAGYSVAIAAGHNFKDWIESEGCDCQTFRVDMQEMMSSEAGQEWTGNSSNPMREAQSMRRMLDDYSDIINEDLWQMAQNTDVLVSGLATFGSVTSIAEKSDKLHITVLLAPIIPSAIGASTMQPFVPERTLFLNRLAGYAGQYFTWWIFKEASNAMRAKLDMPPLTYRQFIRRWNNMPVLYGTSPRLLPPDPDWHESIYVTGAWHLDQGKDFVPPDDLRDFLAAGDAPVYLGFGSMSNKAPEATTQVMIEALKMSGQRGIIYSGWAGLSAADLPEDVFLLQGAPHDWLFPRMKAVVHHGGAGTTAAGLKAGVPGTVVSHMADQPYWGRRLHELGVGAPLIRRHKLTAEGLAQAIRQMATDTAMQQRAADLGAQIREEQGVANAVAAINQILQREAAPTPI